MKTLEIDYELDDNLIQSRIPEGKSLLIGKAAAIPELSAGEDGSILASSALPTNSEIVFASGKIQTVDLARPGAVGLRKCGQIGKGL